MSSSSLLSPVHCPLTMAITKTAGTYDFGFINETFADSLTYTAVTKLPGYWKFTSTGYGVGSTYTSESIVGIADTGTTLIYLPAAIVKAYYADVSGATNSVLFGGWIFDCSATLPDFVFGVGSSKITVPGDYMNFVSFIFSLHKSWDVIQKEIHLSTPNQKKKKRSKCTNLCFL